MANTKVTSHVIADNAITTAMVTDANITHAKLHGTMDLSGKSVTLPAVAIPSASTATTQSASDNTTKLATTAYVTSAISTVIGGAPGTLDTLNELAAAINDDSNYNSTLTTALATKSPLANPTFTTAINGGDNVKLQLGASQDLQIYHDGSNSIISDEGAGELRLRGSSYVKIMDTNNEVGMQFRTNGALTLYHNNIAKLETAATGVDLSGTGALKIPVGTTGERPTAATGQIRFNSTDGALELYNGSAWTAVGTGSSSKILDTFTGNGSATAYTLSVTPANEDALMVFIDGVYQEKGDYALSNAILTLDTAPASGEKLAVHITTASVHDGTSAVNQQFTGNGSATAYTLSQDPKSENNTQVYINGVYQQKTDYTVSGTTLTFDTAPVSGDIIEVNMFTVATLGNTDTMSEGVGNLYHTTARARGAISVSGNALSYNSSTGVITSAYEETPTFTGTVTAPLVDAAILDGENFKINGGQGSDGQVITSTGSGVAWEDIPSDVTVSNSAPGSPSEGDLWFDSTAGTKALKVWNGTLWKHLSSTFTATGGTITTFGGYTIHAFTSSGTFTPAVGGVVDILVVGGGGGSNSGRFSSEGTWDGGGGAGGLRYLTSQTVSAQAYTITIGAGGGKGANGGNSSGLGITSLGGGYGGPSGSAGAAGGSGGGGGGDVATSGGAGTSGQGNAGGPGTDPGGSPYYEQGGGGGGAGEAGNTDGLGFGGDGQDYSTTFGTTYGESGWFAGGGAGGGGTDGTGAINAGGQGGGGDSGVGYTITTSAGVAGATNTGGGGGGGRYSKTGGSGIVLIRYS